MTSLGWVILGCFPQWRGANMTQEQPSAEELKERVTKMGEEANLGAGEEEPDPATAETPPKERAEGDESRTQT
jgi:hypothetical protein